MQAVSSPHQESTDAATGVPHRRPMRGAVGDAIARASVLFFFLFPFPDLCRFRLNQFILAGQNQLIQAVPADSVQYRLIQADTGFELG